jgi:hypothetical protein
LSPSSAINTARKIFKNISIFPQDKVKVSKQIFDL